MEVVERGSAKLLILKIESAIQRNNEKQKIRYEYYVIADFFCGEEEIRTLGTVTGTLAFQASPFDHSGTSPIFFDDRLQSYGFF
jgi:hypothetical protein